jgi:predicted nucleic acid-binding protein
MILYLDTSALVKLYVGEDGSEDVDRAVRDASRVATSAVAYPEARATFARLECDEDITSEEHRAAVADLDADWNSLGVLDLARNLPRFCGRLAQKHGLRGFDAVHLGSAVAVRVASELKREAGQRRAGSEVATKRSSSTPTTTD